MAEQFTGGSPRAARYAKEDPRHPLHRGQRFSRGPDSGERLDTERDAASRADDYSIAGSGVSNPVDPGWRTGARHGQHAAAATTDAASEYERNLTEDELVFVRQLMKSNRDPESVEKEFTNLYMNKDGLALIVSGKFRDNGKRVINTIDRKEVEVTTFAELDQAFVASAVHEITPDGREFVTNTIMRDGGIVRDEGVFVEGRRVVQSRTTTIPRGGPERLQEDITLLQF